MTFVANHFDQVTEPLAGYSSDDYTETRSSGYDAATGCHDRLAKAGRTGPT